MKLKDGICYGTAQLMVFGIYTAEVTHHQLWEPPSPYPVLQEPADRPAFIQAPNFDSTGVNSITTGFEYPPVVWEPEFPRRGNP